MQITIVYDNEVLKAGLLADWGFSCLVEPEGGERILFDTGAKSSILFHNLAKLDLDPGTISKIFISHGHWDHLGGLAGLLKLNRDVKIYLPHSCSIPAGATQAISIQESCEIQENLFSTGELQGIEQSLVVKTREGVVVICGCSHPGVRTILAAASQYGKVIALIGGLHGFKEFDLLEDLKLICPCHCTQYKSAIKQLYPKTCVRGGAGLLVTI
jgi:7,8-dihydropterin-6-yl-methyl-4-(beta-D-ribofuranosyl)aminobenzene 5'-phosphate synthase